MRTYKLRAFSRIVEPLRDRRVHLYITHLPIPGIAICYHLVVPAKRGYIAEGGADRLRELLSLALRDLPPRYLRYLVGRPMCKGVSRIGEHHRAWLLP